MNLVERAKNIVLTPKTEWDAVAADTTPDSQLIVGYVLPLAAIAAVAGFIGMSVLGAILGSFLGGAMRIGFVWGLVHAVYSIVMAVVMCYVVAFIIDALAPTFGGQKSLSQALKVAVYAYTPVWLAGVLMILPVLGILILLAALYAIYLLYLGLPRVMHAPQEKAAGYTAVVVIVAIVVGIVIGSIGGYITRAGMVGGMGSYGMRHGGLTYDRESTVGKLDEFSRKMEQAGKRMEEAQKSGDSGKQMEAALGALGTALSGGKGVEPVQLDQLKPLLPETFAGMPRTDMRTDRSGVKGLMVAKAEGIYGTGDKGVELEVTDTGGAAGFVSLAAWAGVQGEHEDSQRREVTRQEGDRVVHERVDKHGGSNEYTVVVARRFIVSARGRGVDLDTLKSGVSAVDLGKLESLK